MKKKKDLDSHLSPLLYGAPGKIRTCDFQLRRLTLYPLSYGRKRWITLVMDQRIEVKRQKALALAAEADDAVLDGRLGLSDDVE